MQELSRTSQLYGLQMNFNKTKVMTNCPDITTDISVENVIIAMVDIYVYLGQEVLMGKENQTNEINKRIRSAWKAYYKIDYVFKMHSTTESRASIH